MLKKSLITIACLALLGGCAAATRVDAPVVNGDGIKATDEVLEQFAGEFGQPFVQEALATARGTSDPGLMLLNLALSQVIAKRNPDPKAVAYYQLALKRFGPFFQEDVRQEAVRVVDGMSNAQLAVLWLASFRELLLRAEGNPMLDSIIR